ncbi:unnamed protein product [Diamesa tonsa]
MTDHLIDNFSNTSIQDLSLISASQSNPSRTILLNSPGNFGTEIFGPVSFSRTPQTLWKSLIVKPKANLVIEKPQEKELEHKKLMDRFNVPSEVLNETLEISRANRALFMQSLMLSTLQSLKKMENS